MPLKCVLKITIRMSRKRSDTSKRDMFGKVKFSYLFKNNLSVVLREQCFSVKEDNGQC